MAENSSIRKLASRWRNNTLTRWSTGIPSPEDLNAIPDCLYPGYPEKVREYYAGRYSFHDELAETNGVSPFEITPPSPFWSAELNGFGWLANLRQADSPIAQSTAQALVRDWMSIVGQEVGGQAWTAEVTARRLIFWLSHARLILEKADPDFYSDFLQSIARQTRILLLLIKTSPEGMPILLARTAITYSSLCLHGPNTAQQKKHVNLATIALGRELEQQFHADGGHISRNPDNTLTAMALLLPLHRLYLQLQHTPPTQLTTTLDRSLPMLEFFTHLDGSIAHFNGGGGLNQSLLAAVLSAGGHPGKAPENAVQSGYQRIQCEDTALIMDTGKSPAKNISHQMHAGCLSFEMSSGADKFITNCGSPAIGNSKLALATRSTVAHSTAILNNTSSCRFQKNYSPKKPDMSVLAPPVQAGIENIELTRSITDEGVEICASHDGYKQSFGIIHQRTVFLSNDGALINGTDQFINSDAEKRDDRHGTVEIRFHLHPRIQVEQTNNGISVELKSTSGACWTLTCVDARLEIEDSIYFDPESRQTRQILLSSPVPQNEIRWTLQKSKRPDTSYRMQDASAPDNTPHDLLDMMVKKDIKN